MCGAKNTQPDFACEENQRRSDQARAAQNQEAVEKAKEGRLLLNDARQLRFGMQRGIGSSETVARKIARQRAECFLIALLERRGMGNQDRLVVLRSPRKKKR